MLDADEVDQSMYLCNGKDGSAMHAISGTIEPGAYLSLDLTDAAANLSYYAQVVVQWSGLRLHGLRSALQSAHLPSHCDGLALPCG